VVVDDLDHRRRLEMLAVGSLGLIDTDFRRARLADGDKRPRFAGERREFRGFIADEVLGRGAPEQQRDEIARYITLAAAQKLCGRVDAGPRGAVLTIGTIDDRL